MKNDKKGKEKKKKMKMLKCPKNKVWKYLLIEMDKAWKSNK